jgi:hypothetical protein
MFNRARADQSLASGKPPPYRAVLDHHAWQQHCRGLFRTPVERANIDGVSVCRMFNHAIVGQRLPKHVSTDHDPLFRFLRWLANLRVLAIEEVKSVPYAAVSHPFVERLIGTIRREYLDYVLIWNVIDLKRKLDEFRPLLQRKSRSPVAQGQHSR